MSVSPQLAAKEDGLFFPHTFPDCVGLVWFGLDWFGWNIQPVFFIHHKKSIVKTPTQPSLTLVGCYTKMGLHNLAPAAARPDRNFNFFFIIFQKLSNLDSMSVSPQLAAKEDGSFLLNTFPNCGGLFCLGLD